MGKKIGSIDEGEEGFAEVKKAIRTLVELMRQGGHPRGSVMAINVVDGELAVFIATGESATKWMELHDDYLTGDGDDLDDDEEDEGGA